MNNQIRNAEHFFNNFETRLLEAFEYGDRSSNNYKMHVIATLEELKRNIKT